MAAGWDRAAVKLNGITPYYHDQSTTLIHGDALEILPMISDASVALILVDPPYYKTKLEYQGQRVEWDRQWPTREAYLAWLGQLSKEWQRVLKPNGSLYCFASPQMAAHVEVLLDESFTILNRIRWVKDSGCNKKADKDMLRGFLSPWEEIIFAEQMNADSMALGESGYAAQCDTLHGFVFEPLRTYLASERDRAGWTTRLVAEAFQRKTGSRTVTGMAGHWFDQVQWELPTPDNYRWLQTLLNGHDVQYLHREYEDLRREYDHLRREYDDLRREYDDLRREYDDLRRPFVLTPEIPHTDVWDFATVPAGKFKHPCQKPLSLLRHIIKVSSRPNEFVLDCFAGSGSTLEASKQLGRRSVGIEIDESYCHIAVDALRQGILL